MADSTTKKRN